MLPRILRCHSKSSCSPAREKCQFRFSKKGRAVATFFGLRLFTGVVWLLLDHADRPKASWVCGLGNANHYPAPLRWEMNDGVVGTKFGCGSLLSFRLRKKLLTNCQILGRDLQNCNSFAVSESVKIQYYICCRMLWKLSQIMRGVD